VAVVTPCKICVDVTHLVDRHRPVNDITDFTAMDPAALGRQAAARGHLPPQLPLRAAGHQGRRMTTDHALAVLGGLLGGVLAALVARVLEHRLLNPRRPT
jgi:hypothetical protein